MTKNSAITKNGLTIPLSGPLGDQKSQIEQLSGLGFTDVWSAEAMGYDGITPLVLASQWAPELNLGTAILPVYTRGPALMVQSIAALAQVAPGRTFIGLGSSSDVIVGKYNDIDFEEPYKKVRDTLRFIKEALSGEKVTAKYDTFKIQGFRLGAPPPEKPVPILLAALREGMLRLAGREADGAILNWLSPEDAVEISAIVKEKNPSAQIVTRLFVCPNPDREAILPVAKRIMAAYLNVPVYSEFHKWRGRTEMLSQHWELWATGDRAASLDAIPDELVDQIFVHGSFEKCRERIEEYRSAGIDTPVISIIPFGVDEWESVLGLAPSAA